MIIGITGYKRHGKDSVCAAICGLERRAQRIALADPIKAAAREWYGLSHDQTDGDLKESLDERWGLSARQIMQRLGTEVARSIHADTWIRYLLAQTAKQPQTLWVVPDVRFQNEAAVLRAAGAHIWRVHRPSLAPSGDLHASEAEIELISADVQLMNHGSLEDLHVQVESALRVAELIAGRAAVGVE